MNMMYKSAIVFILFTLVISNTGCRKSQESPQKAQEPQHSEQEEISRSEDTGFQRALPQKNTPVPPKKESIVYIADLMQQQQVKMTEDYQKVIATQPDLLLSDISQHGRSKSIFHHPLGIPNTLSFPDITLREHAMLKFDIGIFSNNVPGFVSDGVKFIILLKNGDGEHVIFDKTVTTFDEWQAYAIDLSGYIGQPATIELKTDPLQDGAYDWAMWGSPRIVFFPILQDYASKEISSAARYEGILSSYRDTLLMRRETRVDRGWFADATITDILVVGVHEGMVIQTDVVVAELSGQKDERIAIDVLDNQNNVLTSSEYIVVEQGQEISHTYTVSGSQAIPQKIRVRLNKDNPSVVFIKEPIRYAPRLPETPNDQPNILLISLDTLRADHLGCYGYPKDVSPQIDALAAESFVFTHAYSNSNWTLPAHLSMFTSLYPSQHQVTLKTWTPQGIYRPYDPPYHFITEMFKDANYLTFAFTGGANVGAHYGFNKGFDYHIENVVESNPADIDVFLNLLTPYNTTPMFMFFHTYEIHDYFIDKPTHHQYIQNVFQRNGASLLDLMLACQLLDDDAQKPAYAQIKDKILSEEGIQYIRNLYDGAINYTDTQLGRLFDGLKQLNLYDNTWIIITSDHGEGFGDQHANNITKSWHHGARLYDDQIRVPLIIKPPRGMMSKLRQPGMIDTFVQLIDLAPTLSSVVGLAPHEQFSGQNLMPLLSTSESFSAQPVFSEEVGLRRFACISGNYKLVMTHRKGSLANDIKPLADQYRYELYDLKNDSLEIENLIGSAQFSKHAPIYNELKQLLLAHIQELYTSIYQGQLPQPSGMMESPSAQEALEDLDPKDLQRLKDLGYL